ncbi:hypothetical protein BB561_006771 [Smittium simulii]|uniref:Uncharacterized protein n=1 Tax=Smittium simulii TaxID=133385 RepID=A0A2T9Y1N5_9FUNG|nr:hypothetical protein BB561_006771 [Smittium simulii]
MSGLFSKIFGDLQTTAQVAWLLYTILSLLVFLLPPSYSSNDPLPTILLNLILVPAHILKYPWTILITCWSETDILSV